MTELPTVHEKSKQIFFAQAKVHHFEFAEMTKMVPIDPLWLVTYFKQCQTANKTVSVLDKLKEKKQPN
jgi:hypothetical protein